MTQETFERILNSRKPVSAANAGLVKLVVQGNGRFAAQSDKVAFDRWIYNLKANSTVAMARPETKAIAAKLALAFKIGDEEAATILANEYLNAVQLSFNTKSQSFADGQFVEANIELVDTKAGHKALAVRSVTKVIAKEIASRKFNLTDLMTEVAPATDELPVEETVKA